MDQPVASITDRPFRRPAPWLVFVLAAAVGFASAVYLVPQYAPEIGQFYACDSAAGAQKFGFAVLKAEKTGLGGEPYHVRSATFHSNHSGCGATTEEAGSGGSLSGPVTCNGGNDDCYTYRWNPNLDVHCGRYQLDAAAYRDSDNSWIQGAGIGVVLDWGVNCVAPTAPPRTLAPTAPPRTLAPTPTPVFHMECGFAASPLAGGTTTRQAACIRVTGPGSDTCTTDADCPTPTPTPAPTCPPGTVQVGMTNSIPPQPICANPTPTPTETPLPPLVCEPAQSQVMPGGSQTFTASGGVEYCIADFCVTADSYSWSAPGASPSTGLGSTFQAAFQQGNYTVTVSQANRTAVCQVAVTSPTPTVTASVTPCTQPTPPVCPNGTPMPVRKTNTDRCITGWRCPTPTPVYTPLPTYVPPAPLPSFGNPPPVVQVQTGPGETTVLALIVSAIVTLLYVGYTSTDAFRRREAGGIAQDATGTPDFKG